MRLLGPSSVASSTGSALSYAISMQDARLIARLRRGEREALAGLQEEWRDAVWSVCSAMTGSEREAQSLVQAMWRSLKDDTRGWSATSPLCCQLAGLLCRLVASKLDLPQPDEEGFVLRYAERTVHAQDVSAMLPTIPPSTRLIFLLDLFFECPADALAHATGVPEPAVRSARSAAIWRFVPLGSVDARAWSRELQLLPDLLADDLPAPDMEKVRGAVEADAALEALADALHEAREVCRAVLLQPVPVPAAVATQTRVAPRDVLGAWGGMVLGLLAVLAASLFLLPARPPLGPLAAAHMAAVGHAPGFIAEEDPARLEEALRRVGVPAAQAQVLDGAALRLRLRGGQPAPGGALGAVTLYSLDGRLVTIQSLPAAPWLGGPAESWEVRGVRLAAWQEGELGLVVMSEPAVGRVRAFGSSMPVQQLLALLAWGLRTEQAL